MATTRTHREITAPRAAHSVPPDGEVVRTWMVSKGSSVESPVNNAPDLDIRPGGLGALAADRDRAYPAGSPLPCR